MVKQSGLVISLALVMPGDNAQMFINPESENAKSMKEPSTVIFIKKNIQMQSFYFFYSTDKLIY